MNIDDGRSERQRDKLLKKRKKKKIHPAEKNIENTGQTKCHGLLKNKKKLSKVLVEDCNI